MYYNFDDYYVICECKFKLKDPIFHYYKNQYLDHWNAYVTADKRTFDFRIFGSTFSCSDSELHNSYRNCLWDYTIIARHFVILSPDFIKLIYIFEDLL